MSRVTPAETVASNTLREPARLTERVSSAPPMMMNARWTTTSASFTR